MTIALVSGRGTFGMWDSVLLFNLGNSATSTRDLVDSRRKKQLGETEKEVLG